MDIKSIIADLTRFSDVELFYKRCYELGSDKRALKEYIDDSDQKEEIKSRIALTADSTENRETETYRFSEDRGKNVFLSKKERYIPPLEHCHDYFEVLYAYQGHCENFIEGKRITMSAGSLCFIAPQINHHIEVFDDDSIVIIIHIRKTTFDEVFFNLLIDDDILSEFFLDAIYGLKPKTIEYIIFDIGGDTEMMEQLYALIIEQERNDKYSSRIMDNQISIFMALLVRKHGNTPRVQRTSNDTKWYRYIAYINENFRTVTLAQVARHFSISISHCSRFIKAQTGRRFTDLVSGIRLRHAQSLLASSNMKIQDISYSLGYKNQETFIRGYKKAFGLTPGQYRQNSLVPYGSFSRP